MGDFRFTFAIKDREPDGTKVVKGFSYHDALTTAREWYEDDLTEWEADNVEIVRVEYRPSADHPWRLYQD